MTQTTPNPPQTRCSQKLQYRKITLNNLLILMAKVPTILSSLHKFCAIYINSSTKLTF
jgi:hypothetical protein